MIYRVKSYDGGISFGRWTYMCPFEVNQVAHLRDLYCHYCQQRYLKDHKCVEFTAHCLVNGVPQVYELEWRDP